MPSNQTAIYHPDAPAPKLDIHNLADTVQYEREQITELTFQLNGLADRLFGERPAAVEKSVPAPAAVEKSVPAPARSGMIGRFEDVVDELHSARMILSETIARFDRLG